VVRWNNGFDPHELPSAAVGVGIEQQPGQAQTAISGKRVAHSEKVRRQEPGHRHHVLHHHTHGEDPQNPPDVLPVSDAGGNGDIAEEWKNQAYIFVEQFISIDRRQADSGHHRSDDENAGQGEMPDGPCGRHVFELSCREDQHQQKEAIGRGEVEPRRDLELIRQQRGIAREQCSEKPAGGLRTIDAEGRRHWQGTPKHLKPLPVWSKRVTTTAQRTRRTVAPPITPRAAPASPMVFIQRAQPHAVVPATIA
jgi:hypothetical protein